MDEPQAATAAPPRYGFGPAIVLVGRTVVHNARACLALAALYAVVQGLANAIFRSTSLIVDPTTVSATDVAVAAVFALTALGVLLVINVFVVPVTVGALSLVGSAAVYGDEIEFGGVVRRAMDRALDAVGAFLLVALIVISAPVAFTLLALLVGAIAGGSAALGVLIFSFVLLIVPTLYIGVRLSLAIPVVMREGRGPVESIRRSWELTAGAWWWVFVVGVVVGLVVVALNLYVSVSSIVRIGGIGGFASGLIVSGAVAAVSIVLWGVASGVVYASRAPEEAIAPAPE